MTEYAQDFVIKKRYQEDQAEAEKLKENGLGSPQKPHPVLHQQLAPFEKNQQQFYPQQQPASVRNNIKFNGEIKGGKK